MSLQDLFGSAVQAYDQRRQIETERAWQTQQRQGTLAALERQQRESRLKALQAQGEAFLNAGMVDQAARLVPQATALQGQLSGSTFEAPTFVGEPGGPGQPNNLNNPRTDAAVRAWLGVEPQKPMAVAFGTSLVDPRTGRAVYDGTGQRLAVEAGKNDTRLQVAQVGADSREQVAAERIASAERILGRRLSAEEAQIVLRGQLASSLETQRQGGREALAATNNQARADLAQAKPTTPRRAIINGHVYSLGADGKPAQHLGASKDFDAGAFTRTWLAQQGVMPAMGVPSNLKAAYDAALAAARQAHSQDPLRLPAQRAPQGQGRPQSLREVLQMLEGLPETGGPPEPRR